MKLSQLFISTISRQLVRWIQGAFACFHNSEPWCSTVYKEKEARQCDFMKLFVFSPPSICQPVCGACVLEIIMCKCGWHLAAPSRLGTGSAVKRGVLPSPALLMESWFRAVPDFSDLQSQQTFSPKSEKNETNWLPSGRNAISGPIRRICYLNYFSFFL